MRQNTRTVFEENNLGLLLLGLTLVENVSVCFMFKEASDEHPDGFSAGLIFGVFAALPAVMSTAQAASRATPDVQTPNRCFYVPAPKNDVHA